MQKVDSADSKGEFVYLKYVGHIAVMTGKIREAINLEGVKTISDLISKLDKEYPGLREVFMPPGGVFNSRTAIILRRAGQGSFSIINEEEQIKDGDILTFW
jgi:molybdopterin converting factor small subunit